MKQNMTNLPIISLLDFQKVFELEFDASNIGNSAILCQVSKPIAFYSEKFNDSWRKYSIYNNEFYVIVHTLDH